MTEIDAPRHDVAAALAAVRRKLTAAAVAAHRDPADVTLVAVSKTHPVAAIESVLAAGHRDFGENRVQEAMTKYPALKARHPDLKLHLIGPLQTNKVRDAVKLFDVIHSLDRNKLAGRLSHEMQVQRRRLPCFIQVNTGREPQKAGIDPDEVGGFLARCRIDLYLEVVGLMCIPPVNENPALHFAFLRELARRHGLTQLSMGMSGDAVDAVAFGATHVRVGTAIFGPRPAAAVDVEPAEHHTAAD
ncbi:MAG: YggS family pyridoxal phosphate-dependent enzyme [Rhodospirillaceae bacterium]|nr:YggS family pyridoxal phosphate-dependent enzyme [Rhodospirillaceae bacterium]